VCVCAKGEREFMVYRFDECGGELIYLK